RFVIGRGRRGGRVATGRGDLYFALLPELLYREVVEDSLLDLLQVVVIFVENCPALGDVDGSTAGFVPGERNHPLEEGANDAELWRTGRHLIQPRHLALRLLARLRREIRLLDLLAKLARFEVLGIGFPELPLDASHLLAEHELALRLAQLLGGVGGDLPLQLLHGDLVLQDLPQPPQLAPPP